MDELDGIGVEELEGEVDDWEGLDNGNEVALFSDDVAEGKVEGEAEVIGVNEGARVREPEPNDGMVVGVEVSAVDSPNAGRLAVERVIWVG